MSAGLVKFLRECLWDDECYARNATERAGAEWEEIWSGSLETADDLIMTNDSQVSRFMERFDPARVLADVAAKRAILTQLEDGCRHPPRIWCEDCTGILLALARAYASHRDFNPAWTEETR